MSIAVGTFVILEYKGTLLLSESPAAVVNARFDCGKNVHAARELYNAFDKASGKGKKPTPGNEILYSVLYHKISGIHHISLDVKLPNSAPSLGKSRGIKLSHARQVARCLKERAPGLAIKIRKVHRFK